MIVLFAGDICLRINSLSCPEEADERVSLAKKIA